MTPDKKNNSHCEQESLASKPLGLDRYILIIGDFLSLFFVLTVAISFSEIVMRYCFNAPTIWVHETATFIGGALFVIGGAYALANDKHVRVVLLYDYVSERTKYCLNIFHCLAGMLLNGMLIYGAWLMVINSWLTPRGEWHLETSGSAWNPMFPALIKGLILLVLAVMFIQFLLHLIRNVRLISSLSRVAKNV